MVIATFSLSVSDGELIGLFFFFQVSVSAITKVKKGRIGLTTVPVIFTRMIESQNYRSEVGSVGDAKRAEEGASEGSDTKL